MDEKQRDRHGRHHETRDDATGCHPDCRESGPESPPGRARVWEPDLPEGARHVLDRHADLYEALAEERIPVVRVPILPTSRKADDAVDEILARSRSRARRLSVQTGRRIETFEDSVVRRLDVLLERSQSAQTLLDEIERLNDVINHARHVAENHDPVRKTEALAEVARLCSDGETPSDE